MVCGVILGTYDCWSLYMVMKLDTLACCVSVEICEIILSNYLTEHSGLLAAFCSCVVPTVLSAQTRQP